MTLPSERVDRVTPPSPRSRDVRDIHGRFVSGEVDPAALESSAIRPVVAQSWRRSLAKGVDPDLGGARPAVQDVAGLRDSHPLAPALPIIRRLLVDDAVEDEEFAFPRLGLEGRLVDAEGL